MCTKTKTSFGCGHKLKDLAPCGEPGCVQVDRYAFLKEGDCQSCRTGGETVTRGKDGRGRYAQQLYRHRDADTSPPSRQNKPTQIDISGGRGPWMPETRVEKAWESPTRKLADNAWLSEHEDRISDLQEKIEQFSLSSRSSRESSPRESRGKVSTIIDEDESTLVAPRPRKDTHAHALPYEIQIVSDDSDQHYRRHRRHRKNSRGSEDSMLHYAESPVSSYSYMKNKVVAPDSEYEYYAPLEQKSRRRRKGVKTEPHHSRSYTYDLPIIGSGLSGGHLSGHYEMIQPQQYNFVYPRSYRVH